MSLAVALERGGGVDIGLLQLDAPIAELVERDGAPGHRAAHELAGREHLDLAVEIFELGLAFEAEVAFEAVHQAKRLDSRCWWSQQYSQANAARQCSRQDAPPARVATATTIPLKQGSLLVAIGLARPLAALLFARARIGMDIDMTVGEFDVECGPGRHLGRAPDHRAPGIAHESKAACEHVV